MGPFQCAPWCPKLVVEVAIVCGKHRHGYRHVAHEVSTGAAAYRLVGAGMGFTFADAVALDPELEDKTVLVPWSPVMEVEFGYFTTTRSHGHPQVEAFGQALRTILLNRLCGKPD